MKLAQIIQISRIITVVPTERDGKKSPFPFARHVRKIRLGIDRNHRFGRNKNLFQQFGQTGKFKSRILSGVVRLLPFLRFDGVFCMMQTRGDRMTAERIRIKFTGADSGIGTVRKSMHLHTGNHAFVIPADGAQNSRPAFMAAEQFPVFQDTLCLLESLL